MPISIEAEGANADPDLQTLLHSDAYLNQHHPRHGEAVRAVTEWFQADHGNQPHGLRRPAPVVIDSADIFRSTHATKK
jgi:hypothetical protein